MKINIAVFLLEENTTLTPLYNVYHCVSCKQLIKCAKLKVKFELWGNDYLVCWVCVAVWEFYE